MTSRCWTQPRNHCHQYFLPRQTCEGHRLNYKEISKGRILPTSRTTQTKAEIFEGRILQAAPATPATSN